MIDALSQIEGAFALVAITNKELDWRKGSIWNSSIGTWRIRW